MVDFWLRRMRVEGYQPIQILVGRLTKAIDRRDIGAVREIIANMRFALACMEELCYKIEQEQAEEVM